MKPVQILLLFLASLGGVRAAELSPGQHFLESVKPLLDSRCISCHGHDKVKGGLRLDSRAATLKGGDNGPALIPGKPQDSLLLQAVMHTKPDLEMPPKEKLTARDVAVLERWILDRAPWPEAPAPKVEVAATPGERLGDAWTDPKNPITRIFGGQRLDLWSLRPVARQTPPVVNRTRWVRNPIDQFILARLEHAGLKRSPEADRRALARRLYFDLTGLPPTPEELREFTVDTSPDAYENLVERLLNSPRYGERWGREWLDVVRYSDSNGFDWDEYRKTAWRFRDYVIRAFNADKPFDQFIREQLAGDELLDGPPTSPEEQDALIATGYLRLGPQDNSAPLFNEQARARAELMSDLVETTGSAFLGLTMSCCRCHDHKYDPLSHADHFRLRAFFEGVKYADDLPLDLAPDQTEIRTTNEGLDKQIKPLQEKRDAITAAIKTRLREEKAAKLSDDERALLLIPKDKRADDQKEKIEALEKKVAPSDKEIDAALGEGEKKERETLDREIAALKKLKREFTLGLLMTDSGEKPPATHVLFQGDYKHEREAVPPGFISALDPNPAEILKPKNSKSTGRRLTLASWIASPENPFTARVLVNRVWQGHFGRGLVATPNDFGLAGSAPTHPELLDWLAVEFVRNGWSLKKLHRLIVSSSAYRQASSPPESSARELAARFDSENNLLWRQNLRRVTAEQLRDSLLLTSGRLKDYPGGPPVWPELPADVLQANPAFLDDNAEKTKGWYPTAPSNRIVRSIYMIQKRTVRVPFMETFDLPENSVSCARRIDSTVAPQALTLLNSAEAIEAATAFAGRVENEAGPVPEKQVERAFKLALQRNPEPQEKQLCLDLMKKRSLSELCRSLLNLNEFVYID